MIKTARQLKDLIRNLSTDRASSPLIFVRRSSQQPENAARRSILLTRLRPLMKLRPTRTWKSCGGLIRRSSPMLLACRGIRSWNPSAAYMSWRGSNRAANRDLMRKIIYIIYRLWSENDHLSRIGGNQFSIFLYCNRNKEEVSKCKLKSS